MTAKVNGLTALHLAAEKGQTSVIEALIEAGLPVDVTDHYNYTPLFKALSRYLLLADALEDT